MHEADCPGPSLFSFLTSEYSCRVPHHSSEEKANPQFRLEADDDSNCLERSMFALLVDPSG